MSKAAYVINICIITSILFFSLCVANAFATAESGFSIRAGNFYMMISYSDALARERENEFKFVEDPSDFFFDLVNIFQQNYERISNAKKEYDIVILSKYDYDASRSRVSSKPQEKSTKLQIVLYRIGKNGQEEEVATYPTDKLTKKLLANIICKILPASKCSFGEAENTYLYIPAGDQTIEPSCVVIRPPQRNDADFKKVQLTRKNIGKYFYTMTGGELSNECDER